MKDTFEIQENSIKNGQKVVVIDDVIATGGSIKAAIDLVKSIGGIVTHAIVIIGFEEERWLKNLFDININIDILFKYIK